MEYRTIRIYPYAAGTHNTELSIALSEGWQLQGSPFQARPDEFFQAVTRSTKLKEPAGGPEALKAAASLKEPVSRG
jgi:hypothetical protein